MVIKEPLVIGVGASFGTDMMPAAKGVDFGGVAVDIIEIAPKTNAIPRATPVRSRMLKTVAKITIAEITPIVLSAPTSTSSTSQRAVKRLSLAVVSFMTKNRKSRMPLKGSF
jgi:hypothetical protein